MNSKKICLTWHNLNSTNYGVGALAISHIGMIVQACRELNFSPEITTIGTTNSSDLNIKEKVEVLYNIKINHVDFLPKSHILSSLTSKSKYTEIIKEQDIILDIGEGDSFTDIYGMKRFITQSLTKIIAIKNNKKHIFAPQTIGPFNRKISLLIAKYLMRKSNAVFARDKKSQSLLESIGITSIYTPDVAFSLPFENTKTIENSIGINVSGLMINNGYTGKNEFGLKFSYEDFIVDLINGMLARNKRIFLISHVICDDLFVEDDYRACIKIKNSHFKSNENVVVGPKFTSPIEAKSYISGLEFFSGARMHATIAAISAGIPTIPIAYSRKFSGVFGSIGYNYTLDAYTMDKKTIIQKFFNLYDNNRKEMQIDAKNSASFAKSENKKYISHLKEML